jgi:hypothetical protein
MRSSNRFAIKRGEYNARTKLGSRRCDAQSVAAVGQKRQVNKADGMSDSPPIAPHCRFARGEHNSQWYAV